MNKKNISIKNKEYILDCLLIVFILQIIRIIIKSILLSVFNFTDINLNIANIVSIMIVGISIFLFLRGSSLFNPAGYRLTEMANNYEHKKIRVIFLAVTLISLIFTIVIKTEYIFYELVILCLTTIVVPIYEEMLFRQYLWNYVKSFVESEKVTWIIISIISVLFILGYWDIVSQNLQVISSDKFAVDVITSKMGLGIIIAAATGFVKYKYKDIYLCIFLHIIISCIFL